VIVFAPQQLGDALGQMRFIVGNRLGKGVEHKRQIFNSIEIGRPPFKGALDLASYSAR